MLKTIAIIHNLYLGIRNYYFIPFIRRDYCDERDSVCATVKLANSSDGFAISNRKKCAMCEKLFWLHNVFRFLIIFRMPLMAVYGACENSPDTIPVIFSGRFPIARRNRISDESYLGGRGKIQFECSVKRRVQTPYAKCPFVDPVALRNHSAPAPFALPPRLSPSSRCTLAAQHSTCIRNI